MSVKLDIYNLIQPLIAAIPEIQTVRLWNNQPDNEPREQAFLYPAVFVGYDIEWQPYNAGTVTPGSKILYGQQHGTATITLYVCFSRLQNETDIFTDVDSLLHKVHTAVMSANYQASATVGQPYRSGEAIDDDHDRVSVFTVNYVFPVVERPEENTSAQQFAPQDSQGNPATVGVSANLTIDPNTAGKFQTDGV